jgi:putative acetyltransferase
MTAVQIIPVSAPTEDVRDLIAQLNAELSALYTDAQCHGLAVQHLFQPHIRFFVAYADGRAIGCGGIALLDGFAELKRMYVRKDWRGRGVADQLVAKLTAETIASGRELLRLETGSHSYAALRFYDRCGFQPCTAFEPYTRMPPPSTVTSVFLEKRLCQDAVTAS